MSVGLDDGVVGISLDDLVGLDDSLGLGGENVIEGIKSKDISLSTPTFSSIVPSKGLFLGLDISKSSTGVCYVENGVLYTGNITLDDVPLDSSHREVMYRRNLKKELEDIVRGKHFELIIIEDAFIGENADTVRLLFALNTAIDELVLDGVCSCSTFVRVSNKSWKSWLYSLDTTRVTKGYNDKEKIRWCMEALKVSDSGKGSQDRLDACGLVAGYFLMGKNDLESGRLTKSKRVRFSDVNYSYDIDKGYVLHGARDDIFEHEIVTFESRNLTKKKIIDMLSKNPDKVFICNNPIILGNLGNDLGVSACVDAVYLAFWVSRDKLSKYLK